MLQLKNPDDYVISTGESYSVDDFLSLASKFSELDDWNDFVKIDQANMRPTDIEDLTGDSTKAQKQLGWKPKTSFSDLVKLMVDHDIEFEKLFKST